MSFDSELTQFSKLFRKHLSDNQQAQIRWVTASEVNATNYTMTAVGLTDGLEYYNIMLGSANMGVIPAVGSPCLIGLVEGEEAHTFLIYAKEPDKVIVNTDNDITVESSNGSIAIKSDKGNISINATKGITINADKGLSIKGASIDLYDLLSNLVTVVAAITASSPADTIEITKIKQNLASLLKIAPEKT
jgi:hypothetical protein